MQKINSEKKTGEDEHRGKKMNGRKRKDQR